MDGIEVLISEAKKFENISLTTYERESNQKILKELHKM